MSEKINERPPNKNPINEAIAEIYFKDLGINWDMLRGKKTLDLGSGLGHFAEVAKAHGVEIVSVDAHPEWHHMQGKPAQGIPYIVGDGKQLPFKDNSFDLMIARASVHSMVEVKEDLLAVLSEARRILRAGGEFRFGPGSIHMGAMRRSDWNKWSEIAAKIERGEPLTKEEEALRARIWPEYKRESKLDIEFDKLSDEKRTEAFQQINHDRLLRIDPSIKAHPFIRTIKWHGKMEQEHTYFYVYKKESPVKRWGRKILRRLSGN